MKFDDLMYRVILDLTTTVIRSIKQIMSYYIICKRPLGEMALDPLSLFFFFFLSTSHTCDIWKFKSQGLNWSCSCQSTP